MRGAELRQSLLTNNLANADTPGYKPEDVSFQSTLASALAQGQSPSSVTFTPFSESGATNADGNGVSEEQTQADISSNGLLYEDLTAIATQRDSILTTAMGTGSSS